MPDLADWDRRHLAIPKELLATQAGSLFIWPALGRVSSPFGPRFYGKRGIRVHEGLDIPLPYGSAIHAARAGVVKKADSSLSGYGRMVEIDHGGGIVTRYAHCSSFAVTKGQRVDAGQVIAYAGSSGRSSNAHLHFEIRLDGVAYNPMVFLQSAPTGDRMVRK
jgi:murein DD-endopeptidase MepM/ murein hydrolase activator NlpD